ncbi:hypothetical protein HDV05_004731 [Chytridiales sp. JEL 0842]|nr:hypothetical protein HDV05_004731 [Chytridiales sp. JEL 0842]
MSTTSTNQNDIIAYFDRIQRTEPLKTSTLRIQPPTEVAKSSTYEPQQQQHPRPHKSENTLQPIQNLQKLELLEQKLALEIETRSQFQQDLEAKITEISDVRQLLKERDSLIEELYERIKREAERSAELEELVRQRNFSEHCGAEGHRPVRVVETVEVAIQCEFGLDDVLESCEKDPPITTDEHQQQIAALKEELEQCYEVITYFEKNGAADLSSPTKNVKDSSNENEELISLKVQLHQQDLEMDEHKTQIQQLEEALRGTLEENEELHKRLESEQNKLDNPNHAITNLHLLRFAHATLQQELNQSMRTSNETISELKTALEKSNKEYDQLQKDLEKMQADSVGGLQRLLAKVKDLEKQLGEKKARIQELEGGRA